MNPRFALFLVPFLLLIAVLAAGPLTSQGAFQEAPAAQVSPLEIVSDAPVCVRFYPETGETREGPEICNTRAGDPPPPLASPTR